VPPGEESSDGLTRCSAKVCRVANVMRPYLESLSLTNRPPPPTPFFRKCSFQRTLSPVFLEVFILKVLQANFAEVRILKDLAAN